jgi:hypothetical protein
MGTYPIARVTRPFGSLAGFIFLTDSRVIFGSEAKSFAGSSYVSWESSVESVQGVSVDVKRGFDSKSLAFTIGVILNLLLVIFVAPEFLGNLLGPVASFLVGPLILATLFLAVVTVLVFRNPEVQISLVGQLPPVALFGSRNGAKSQLMVLLTFLMLLLVPFLYALWLIGRELGIWTAADAVDFGSPNDVDHIARELGAQIMDVKARGKMAARR